MHLHLNIDLSVQRHKQGSYFKLYYVPTRSEYKEIQIFGLFLERTTNSFKSRLFMLLNVILQCEAQVIKSAVQLFYPPQL